MHVHVSIDETKPRERFYIVEGGTTYQIVCMMSNAI